jgi:hypothetical protein
MVFNDVDQRNIEEFLGNLRQDAKYSNRELIEERVRDIYLYLASSFVSRAQPLLVAENDWDMPGAWEIPSYSDVLTGIVESQVNDGDSKQLIDIIGGNLLSRDNKSKRLVLPESVEDILKSIATDFENLKIITTLNNEIQKDFGIQPESVISESEIVDCMFHTVWEIHFQIVDLYPHFEFHNPMARNNIKQNLAREFNIHNVKISEHFDSRVRHLMEDQIIMHINRSYSDIIDLCLQAINMYRAGDKIDSNSNPTVNSIHSQILKMAD